jgi:hypothetical protein
MADFITTAFEFVPIAIFSAIFFLMVLFIKYSNHLTLRSVGSDICLGALFIQITLLAAPVWMSEELSINVAGHMAMVTLTLITWIFTVWLLKRNKPFRTPTTQLHRKIISYLIKQSTIRESLSYILGTFALSISLMMMFDIIRLEPADLRMQTIALALAALTSIIIGLAGYNIYRYLQNEQFIQSFERFSKKITEDTILMTIQMSATRMQDYDPVQPVMDIIRGSIMKGVLGPSLFGLMVIKNSCIDLLTTSGMRQQSLNKVTSHFIGHIDDLGKLALRMDEDETVLESIKNMGEIGECALSRGIETPVEDILQRLADYLKVVESKEFKTVELTVTDTIRRIGSAAAASRIESVSSKAIGILGTIGTSAARDKDIATLKETINALYTIGNTSASNSLESSVKHSAVKLRDVGVSSVQLGLSEETLQIIAYLEELGVAAASDKLELGTQQVIWSIKDIGVIYGYQHIDKGINAIVSALGHVGLVSSQKELDEAVDQALWALKEVSRYPISEGMKDSIQKSAQAFAMLAKSQNSKVNQIIQDIKQYFGSDDTERFSRFEQEYISAMKTTGVYDG